MCLQPIILFPLRTSTESTIFALCFFVADDGEKMPSRQKNAVYVGTNHCVRRAGFRLRRYISEGAFGVTYTACKGRGKADCTYVVKLFQGDTDASAQREVRLAKIAGQFGVSPQVFAGGQCRGARTFQELGVKRDIKTKIGYSKIYYITMAYFGSM